MTKPIARRKGQATTPKDVRDRLALQPENRSGLVIDEKRRRQVVSVRIDASELAGMLKAPFRPLNVGSMNRAIRKQEVGRR
ncbi:MAG: hypothetical protein Q8N04_09650 [Nitrospira sp.]|nr:hypothetical protein [Nitrospira sp.]